MLIPVALMGRLILLVDLMGFRFTMETYLWACL